MRNAPITLSTIVAYALVSEANWASISGFAFEVVSIKEQEERRREAVRDLPALSPSSHE